MASACCFDFDGRTDTRFSFVVFDIVIFFLEFFLVLVSRGWRICIVKKMGGEWKVNRWGWGEKMEEGVEEVYKCES